MTKVIYIGGYGHSGSTLLEYLMAGSPSVLACGEVVSSLRKRAANESEKRCSCGRPANECPVFFGMICRKQYVRLRYEDLARSPTDTLQTLLAKLLPDVRWGAEEVGASDNRHQLQGNRIRFREIAIEDVKEDLSWKVEMPPKYFRVVKPLSYLLRLRYGYSSDASHRPPGPGPAY